jgi:uncharacterized protein YkwD
MAFRIGNTACALLVVLAAALIWLAASPLAAGAQGASACEQWGSSGPGALTNGQAREAIACLINRRRENAGLPALDRDRRLQKAAQRHNDRMHGTGCFSHQCSGESGLDTRLRSAGYLGANLQRWAYGENLAWGLGSRATPGSIVEAWMNSSGHRANILSKSFRQLGVGFTAGTPDRKGAEGGTYTVDFGLAVG